MIEREFTALVERHREEQAMSLPPPDLLGTARHERARRRRRTTALTLLIVAAMGLVALGIRSVGSASSHPGAQTPPPWVVAPLRVDPTSLPPASRMVGLNGWALQVPGRWGTDEVGCDRRTALHASVVFDHAERPAGVCLVHSQAPYVRISDQALRHGVPWGTVNGIAVQEGLRPASPCRTCLTLGVAAAHVTFTIHARTPAQLQDIERSLHPLSTRQIAIPVWRGDPSSPPLDQMTRISLAEGLRPRWQEVPSRRPPGIFLRSNPPIGTPVDLGRGVTLLYSAGDLGRIATVRSLDLHGWRVSAATDFAPPVGRETALRVAGQPPDTLAYLRTLTITHEGPRTVRFRNRPAWLVVTSSGPSGNDLRSSIIALDATTGRVLEARPGFWGRSR